MMIIIVYWYLFSNHELTSTHIFSGQTGSTCAAACFSVSSSPFFNASVVRYPSSYSYPGTYETRYLTPVLGYAAETSTFSTMYSDNLIASDWKYIGGVLAPNGLIFFAPWSADNIGVLDPSTSSFTTIDICNKISCGGRYTLSSGGQYRGGVLGPNDLIYFVPAYADNIGVLDPSSSTFTTIDISNTISIGGKYYGGVLGPNGLIYFVPANARNIGVLNPASSSFTTIDISKSVSGNWKYVGGVVGPNGLIYFIPYNANKIGVLYPNSSSFTTIDKFISASYFGGVLGPNGLIYLVPGESKSIGVLNPVSSTFTTIDIDSRDRSVSKYVGGVLGPNGLIYFVPFKADNIGVLNPASSSFTTIDISNFISLKRKYAGGVLGPNGIIYCVPWDSNNIGKLHLSNSNPAYNVAVEEAWSALLSPHFNKF